MAQDRIIVYRSKAEPTQFGWRYLAKNNKQIASSGELYKNIAHVRKMVTYLFGGRIAEGVARYVEQI